ncbi:MAG: DNA polymerase III subunit gamma/tau [Crocinitomicaceae bacterium]|nr:DNA polymerase III subunit gamma/tau [Crocinitomicaceae bacterium]
MGNLFIKEFGLRAESLRYSPSIMEQNPASSYTVSARKYRPQNWDAVVGQDGITRTLKQAIEQEQMAQAYLFCGPRGVGKTTSARIFARAINEFEASEEEDYAFNVFELDAASNNKVEDIRSIVDQVRIPPQRGKYKVYIIDEVHMLSQAAFNAFLKTLEEPPPHAVFVLATTEKHKILPTILSRCQIFDFHRITVPDMVQHLQGICEKEGVEAEESALHVVAVKADGALRDALSIFDQLVAFAGKKLTYDAVAEHLHVLDQQTYFDVVDAARSGAIAPALLLLDEIIARGFDPHHFITGLGAHLRNLLVARDPSTVALMEVTDDVKQQFTKQASEVDVRFLIRSLDLANEADIRFKGSNHQRLLVELMLMQMASHEDAQKKKPELNPIVAGAWKDAGLRDSSIKAAVLQPAPATVKEQIEDEPIAPPASTAPVISAAPQAQKAPKVKAIHVEPETPSVEAVEIAVTVNETNSINQMPQKRKMKLTTPDTLQTIAPAVSKKQKEAFRTKEVDNEAIEKAWTAYAQSVKEADQLNFFSTLKASAIKLEGKQITIQVLNKLQEEQIRDGLLAISQFIADQVENDELKLLIHVVSSEQNEISSQFMTDRERYDGMVKKNPRVEELRKRLDLDLNG